MAYNTEPVEEPSSRNRNNVLIILVVLLLLGSVGYNIFQHMSHKEDTKVLNDKVVSTEELRKELEQEKLQLEATLEEYRGRTGRLDSLVAEKEQDLLKRAEEIERLLKQSKVTYNQYLKAKEDLDKFRFYADKYKRELDEVKKQLAEAKGQVQQLQTERTGHIKTIETLKDTNANLKVRIAVAERLTAEGITVEGIQDKGSGRERSTDRAARVDKFRICFNLNKNDVAKQGTRDVFIQVLDPSGQPVVVETMGSGTTDMGGEQLQYSTKFPAEYDGEAQQYCTSWSKGGEYAEGQYRFILYTEGYKLGEKVLTLK